MPAGDIAAATSARKHAKLCGPSPTPLPLPLPTPLPERPSVSPSSETAERGAALVVIHRVQRRVVGRQLSRARRRTRRAACAVQGTPLCGLVHAAPTTSPKRGSESLVVRRKERAASGAGQPASSIARTVCRPTRAGADSGRVDGSNRPGARRGSGDPVGASGLQGYCRRESRTLRGRRRARRGIGCQGGICTLRGWAIRQSCRAGRCYEKEWLTRARMKRGKWAVPLHFHRCVLYPRACHSTHHSDDVRDSRTGCCRHHLHDAIQTVTMRVWHRVARGHTHTLDLSRDAE